MKHRLVLLLGMGMIAPGALGGVFVGADNPNFDPFIISHAPEYDGTGGPRALTVCVEGEASTAAPGVRDALAIWNGLEATTGNCPGCLLADESTPNPDLPYSMAATILHELGHCALGLGHVNWVDADDGATSFTNSRDAVSFDDGMDDVRGTADDSPSPLPGTRLVHWFRKADNDPGVIDATVIDSMTYSRRILDLPGGSNWPASGNRGTHLLLGSADTQAVMYSTQTPGGHLLGSTADGVDTVAFARTGVDSVAMTADDYDVTFDLASDCTDAAIEVRFVEMLPTDALGRCRAALEVLETGGLDIHHVLVPPTGEDRILVEVRSTVRWDVLFASGFESGDLSEWAGTVSR